MPTCLLTGRRLTWSRRNEAFSHELVTFFLFGLLLWNGCRGLLASGGGIFENHGGLGLDRSRRMDRLAIKGFFEESRRTCESHGGFRLANRHVYIIERAVTTKLSCNENKTLFRDA